MSGLKRFIAIILYIIGFGVLTALVSNPYDVDTKALMDRNLFFFILGGMVIAPIGLGIVITSKKFVDSVWVAGITLIILVIRPLALIQ